MMNMRLLGIDWGKKKIGLALGDDETKIATPFLILDAGSVNGAVEKIKQIVNDEGVGLIVVGQPKKMSGAGGVDSAYQSFLAALKTIGIDVAVEDERLSSKMAGRLMLDFPRKKKKDDDVAAAIILQSYFDREKEI